MRSNDTYLCTASNNTDIRHCISRRSFRVSVHLHLCSIYEVRKVSDILYSYVYLLSCNMSYSRIIAYSRNISINRIVHLSRILYSTRFELFEYWKLIILSCRHCLLYRLCCSVITICTLGKCVDPNFAMSGH
jgi:hypothetical protein